MVCTHLQVGADPVLLGGGSVEAAVPRLRRPCRIATSATMSEAESLGAIPGGEATRRETGPSEKQKGRISEMHIGHGKGRHADGRDTETPNYGCNGWCPEPTSDTYRLHSTLQPYRG